MVSKIITGKSIRGALNYNEKKVKEAEAFPLDCNGYSKSIFQLSFSEKLLTLERQVALNERIKTNCLHISLNFDPSEKLSPQKLAEVTSFYMEELGFGEQPYLVYQHIDVGHPHVHIITTNVQEDGTAISLHNIGRIKSEVARKKTELEFGLVKAEDHKNKKEEQRIKPVVAQKVIYGKGETKAAIANVVKSVMRDYRFTSLAGFNAVLKGYNVQAYRGEPRTTMFEKGGLAYSVLDRNGKRIGVPVKASDLSARPTLKNLEKVFQQKKDFTGHYYRKIREAIDKAISSNLPNLKALESELKKEQIEMVIYQNKQMVYGIAFTDHTSKVVVNGSELGRNYSAKRIQEQLGIRGLLERKQNMLDQERLSAYAKGILTQGNAANALSYIYSNGLKLEASNGKYQNLDYRLSFQDQKGNSSIGLYGKTRTYLEERNITPELCAHLNNHVQDNGIKLIQDYIHGLFAQQFETLFGHIIQDKKKSKRRINW
ncbi:relaxase/mobilization nuclease domain-containing protein [Rhizosphaericola mali]|uniref:Relaxase/mobilization nuclease domain-containing protein n=1 Tax=Rhizosphaericola mali TaxID=2545455 RepID=A0A5P2G959_9BACT|nr:relaxase/mobilization nuclease domain-containing protein [Rhizosphaericola mali]QES88061.1 relaxase/mobilization nuclease domain-containing protein [Rhizosphaericola mali]QES88780.1 relaxase/mobilization nuclease domain-containing protein [Rhizosphaericola mali]